MLLSREIVIMSSIDHLKKLKGKVDFAELEKIEAERCLWHQRPNVDEWMRPTKNLPDVNSQIDFSKDQVVIGNRDEISEEQFNQIETASKALIPWKKGPFNFFGQEIDSEWRSDLKWNRIKEFLPDLKHKAILDIGCNNGYFMFKMAEHNPKYLLGIDPVVPYYAQFKLLQHFAKVPDMHFHLWGVEHLKHFRNSFDVIFSMGIIYHHRNPIQQLIDIREALIPDGTVILETIGIPGEESIAYFPDDKYAKMGNVWFLPTMNCLINWTKKARFTDIEIISDTPLTNEEQRITKWCPENYKSLDDFLDPNDKSLTMEGHPAPRRFCIKAKKKKIG